MLRTSTAPNSVRDLAADWAIAHLDSLFNPPGDYNHNGTTDAADYVVWRKTLGQTGVVSLPMATPTIRSTPAITAFGE